MQAFSVYGMQLAEPGLQLFRYAAGQGVQHWPIDESVEPGTYRIANGLTGTALQISGHDHTRVVSWQLDGRENLEQQWHFERSGSGFVFKNQKHNDLYISVASTDTHALVTASKYPSTWVFLRIGDRYGIKLAEHDKLLDLHFGRKANGTEVHIWPSDGSAKQTWDLLRISAPHQEKSAQLDRSVIKSTEAPPHKEQEANRIETLEKELMQLKGEIVKKGRRITEHEGTIHKLQLDLQARESSDLQGKLSQQQTKIASLQAQIDRLEYLVAQLRGNSAVNSPENR